MKKNNRARAIWQRIKISDAIQREAERLRLEAGIPKKGFAKSEDYDAWVKKQDADALSGGVNQFYHWEQFEKFANDELVNMGIHFGIAGLHAMLDYYFFFNTTTNEILNQRTSADGIFFVKQSDIERGLKMRPAFYIGFSKSTTISDLKKFLNGRGGGIIRMYQGYASKKRIRVRNADYDTVAKYMQMSLKKLREKCGVEYVKAPREVLISKMLLKEKRINYPSTTIKVYMQRVRDMKKGNR